MTSYPFISYTGSGNGYNIVSPPAPKSFWHGEYMIELKATLIHGQTATAYLWLYVASETDLASATC